MAASSRFGALVHDGGVTFSVWAPVQTSVALVIENGAELPMPAGENGFFTLDTAEREGRPTLLVSPAARAPAGSRVPLSARRTAWSIGDRRSSRLSAGPTRSGAARGPRIARSCTRCTSARSPRKARWKAATARLPRLAEMGVTTLEIMPVSEFAGKFGWGYDGVDMFAPSRLYGRQTMPSVSEV